MKRCRRVSGPEYKTETFFGHESPSFSEIQRAHDSGQVFKSARHSETTKSGYPIVSDSNKNCSLVSGICSTACYKELCFVVEVQNSLWSGEFLISVFMSCTASSKISDSVMFNEQLMNRNMVWGYRHGDRPPNVFFSDLSDGRESILIKSVDEAKLELNARVLEGRIKISSDLDKLVI